MSTDLSTISVTESQVIRAMAHHESLYGPPAPRRLNAGVSILTELLVNMRYRHMRAAEISLSSEAGQLLQNSGALIDHDAAHPSLKNA